LRQAPRSTKTRCRLQLQHVVFGSATTPRSRIWCSRRQASEETRERWKSRQQRNVLQSRSPKPRSLNDVATSCKSLTRNVTYLTRVSFCWLALRWFFTRGVTFSIPLLSFLFFSFLFLGCKQEK
jgi:hypothetical protein